MEYEALTTNSSNVRRVRMSIIANLNGADRLAACASKTIFVYEVATRFMNRCKMKGENRTVEIFFRRNQYVFGDVHQVHTIIFQNMIYTVLCICLSANCGNLILQIISTRINVPFLLFTKTGHWQDMVLFHIFFCACVGKRCERAFGEDRAINGKGEDRGQAFL